MKAKKHKAIAREKTHNCKRCKNIDDKYLDEAWEKQEQLRRDEEHANFIEAYDNCNDPCNDDF